METQRQELLKEKESLLKKMRSSTNGLKKIVKKTELRKEKVGKEEKAEIEQILIKLKDIIDRQERCLEIGDTNAYVSTCDEENEAISELLTITTNNHDTRNDTGVQQH